MRVYYTLIYPTNRDPRINCPTRLNKASTKNFIDKNQKRRYVSFTANVSDIYPALHKTKSALPISCGLLYNCYHVFLAMCVYIIKSWHYNGTWWMRPKQKVDIQLLFNVKDLPCCSLSKRASGRAGNAKVSLPSPLFFIRSAFSSFSEPYCAAPARTQWNQQTRAQHLVKLICEAFPSKEGKGETESS